MIDTTGRVEWHPGGVFVVSCNIDMTYFPFDEHECEFQFESWAYPHSLLRFNAINDVIDTSRLQTNSQWLLHASSAYVATYNISKTTTSSFSEWSHFKAKLRIIRKSTYFVINILLPVSAMSMLILLTFYVPPDAGEKISLSMTLLVAYSVFQLTMIGLLPRSSDSTPLLVTYISCLMMMAVVSVLLSVLLTNLYYIEHRPVPEWFRKLVYRFIIPVTRGHSLINAYTTARGQTCRNYSNCNAISHSAETRPKKIPENHHPVDHEADAKQTDETDFHGIENYIWGEIKPGSDKAAWREGNLRDWRLLAKLLDRLFLMIYLLLTALVIVVIFSLLIHGSK
ncbi:neuronal acetylcholine receptor subunit non-alpha-2-like [Tubulanus polymorphus]|uniref:neuronal acetylcholine receptor subunit non-alpha-2-like n=1 Tax=Tubulanus polymorphus TaxID=672921 RepID=UPI003DA519E3